MRLDAPRILRQLDSVIRRYREAVSEVEGEKISNLPILEKTELTALMSAAIDRLAPPNSRYFEEANRVSEWTPTGRLEALVGIVQALKFDYAADNLQSVSELIHADVFSDFLEMADYLLEQGYKDPSAVIVGSVLEEHLRKLCFKNKITVLQNQKPKKADTLNAELANANVYTKLDQKSITAWLDLRNKAAHGKYSEYTTEQVDLMVQSIRNFIARHPA